jgi:hypothetical protein
MAEADITRTVQAVARSAERVIKRLGFEIQGELIRKTPVDTGWARANWVVSIGTPHTGVVGSREAVSQAGQIAGQGRLLVYRLNQGQIWISNNVPYIGKLNEGHSKQAPAGYIEQAIDTAIRTIVR